MERIVDGYKKAVKRMFEKFGCTEQYFVKEITDYNWMIKEENKTYFLTYWKNNKAPVSTIIVKKDGDPLIYKLKDYTMLIGIECIKVAFILKNTDNIENG